MKPSERVKQFVPAVAQQRLAKMKEGGGIRNGIIDLQADARLLKQLGNEPMTWVIAVLTYLDNEADMERPSTRLRPKIMQDGNQWCALYGDNLQEGISGFGDTPEEAYADFDREWLERRANAPIN
jgi:hypothetical protein